MIGRGSRWHRWEPHIHAPGTLMNDQFTGPTAWEDYLSALEAATPTIEAIAVTEAHCARAEGGAQRSVPNERAVLRKSCWYYRIKHGI